MSHKLSVLIPCKNEQIHIRDCIESVRDIADEIVVADSGSTDSTLDIVAQVGGCRVIEREYVNSANFKNWAIPQCQHDWVLVVDADERVTPELAAEIQKVLAGTPKYDGYAMRRAAYFVGRHVRFSGVGTNTVIRLFRRQLRYHEKWVHADVDCPEHRVALLQNKFLHYTCTSLTEYAARQNRYATWSARDMYNGGRTVGFAGLLFRPFWRFAHHYLLRGGFLDGVGGLLVCAMGAYYVFLKYAKLWEFHHTHALSELATPSDEEAAILDAALGHGGKPADKYPHSRAA